MQRRFRGARKRTGGERGVALVGVLLFAVVVGLTGLAFYAMASYEFKSAEDRQESSEAFYLADGAVERARGEILIDKTWRGPVTGAAGSGAYTASAADTLYKGFPAVLLRGEGTVGDGSRGVEVFASVRDLLDVVAIHASRDMIANGNLNVYDRIHVNGDGYFGPDDDHLKSGTYDEGYVVRPPAIDPTPENFPKSTFYQVRVKDNPSVHVDVWRWDHDTGWKQVQGSAPQELNPAKVSSGPNVYKYAFNASEIPLLFNQVGGYFTRLAGDSSVVVDFGNPNTPDAVVDIDFQMNDDTYRFETTIINSRFTGIDEGDNRIAPCSGFWKGGNVTFGNKLTWVPRNCVALVTNHLGPPQGQQPNAQGSLGTAANPALTYVTGNVEGIKGQLQIHGILISLCDIASQGGPDVWHEDIQDCLPAGLLSGDGSGFVEALEWREVGL